MDVKVVSKRLVKPCTPTPEKLRKYKISFMDELNPTMNVVGIYYYQSPAATTEQLHLMEGSLSEILPSFYPFSGRYVKGDRTVDCSDQGALVVEADVDLELEQVINPNSKLEVEDLNDLLPCEIGAADEVTDPILHIQFNRFKCGGLAISICISHRVVDACSLGVFLSAWTNATRGGKQEAICPSFDGPVFFPGKNFPEPEFGMTRARENGLFDIICKRFIIDRNAISRLKARVGEKCSRIGAVSGLVVMAIDRAARARSGAARDLVVAQAVNIRERTVPAVSKYSCGNLVDLAITECRGEETKEMKLEDYIRLLSAQARKTVEACAGLLSEDGKKSWIERSHDASEKSLREDVNVVWVTDWAKFGFDEADFGWGKPVWASVANVMVKNHVLLLNAKDGDGIEAWVQLEKSDVPYFQHQFNSFISAA